MRKMKVKLYSVEDVKDFVNIMGSIEGEYFSAAEDILLMQSRLWGFLVWIYLKLLVWKLMRRIKI